MYRHRASEAHFALLDPAARRTSRARARTRRRQCRPSASLPRAAPRSLRRQPLGRGRGRRRRATPDTRDGIPGTRALAAQTVRMVVRPHRARGTRPGPSLAPVRRDRDTDRGTRRWLSGTQALPPCRGRCAGSVSVVGARVTLDPGHDLTSDAVRLPIRPGQDLLVSLHIPDVVERPTEHFHHQPDQLSRAGPGPGDLAADESGGAFAVPSRHAFSVGWLLPVRCGTFWPLARRTGAVVAFGDRDSITDGFQVTGERGRSKTRRPSTRTPATRTSSRSGSDRAACTCRC